MFSKSCGAPSHFSYRGPRYPSKTAARVFDSYTPGLAEPPDGH